jgi:hypothetical protein
MAPMRSRRVLRFGALASAALLIAASPIPTGGRAQDVAPARVQGPSALTSSQVGVTRAVGVVSAGVATAAAVVQDRLPDLRVARLRDFTIRTASNGHRLLRFTTILTNTGKGPFELRGSRSSTSKTFMPVYQRIYTTAGTNWRFLTQTTMRYSGDGHNHWHAQRIATYALRPVADQKAVPRRGAKTGFCFFDTNAMNLSLPGAPGSARYRASGCGTRSSLSTVVGISVGWGDRYTWSLPFQWIDITGLRAGDYKLCVVVDAQDWFAELNQANNYQWSDVRVPSSGSTVTVLRSGTSACAP